MSETVIHIQDVQLRRGTVIAGRYKVESHLGEGGFAQIFAAFDTNIERRVAIKFLNLHISQTDQDATDNILARFKREAKLAAKIQHPNVVNIFDFGLVGQNQTIPFIVMELLSGYDLEHQIYDKSAMSPDRIIPLFIKCLEALGEAHKLGIVHKDLKPSNLFLSNPGARTEALRIVDFGIAHIRDAREGRLTATGDILGTPQYLSPEYIESQTVSPAFDVYQMGLILVEALLGRPVVDEDHPLRCVKIHSMGQLDLPTELLDSPLGPVLERALDLDHTARFANAEAFADALAEIDVAQVPEVTPQMPTSRLNGVAAGDSHSRLNNGGTGRMSQPTTGQLPVDEVSTPAGADDASAQRTRQSEGPTDQVPGSTQTAIANAKLSRRGMKALAFLAVFVIVAGGSIVWLLLADHDDTNDPSGGDHQVSGDPPPEVASAGQPDRPSQVHMPARSSTDPASAGPPVVAAAVDAGGGDASVNPHSADPIEVTVTSSPPQATVSRGDDELGQTPVSVEFDSAEDAAMKLHVDHQDYQSKRITVTPGSSSPLSVALEKDPPRHRAHHHRSRPKKRPASREAAKPDRRRTKSHSSSGSDRDPPDKSPSSDKQDQDDQPQRMLIAP